MARIEVVSSTSTTMSLRIVELTYLNSYNTLNNAQYPRYGTIKILIGLIGQNVSIYSAGSSSGNNGYTTTATFTGLNPSTTYNSSAEIYYYNSNYPSDSTSWGISNLSLSITTPSAPRPSTFSWTYSKVSGGNMNLTATEWNSLCNNINLVRQYKGLSNYYFETVYSGGTFLANHYNMAVYAIRAISGYSSVLSIVNNGDIIYASLLNNLVSTLNSIT